MPTSPADTSLAILERALAEADQRPRPGHRLWLLAHTGTHWREPRLLAWMEQHLPGDAVLCTEGAAFGRMTPRERLAEVLGGIVRVVASPPPPGRPPLDAGLTAQLWTVVAGEPPLTAADVELLRRHLAAASGPEGVAASALLDDPEFIRALVKDAEASGIDWMKTVNKPHLLRPALGFAISAPEGFALLHREVRLYGIEDPRHYAHNLEISRRGGVDADFMKVASLRSQVLFENCIRAMDETGSASVCAYLTGFHRGHFLQEAARRQIRVEMVQVTELDD
ncbi:hypothetical protein [Thiococcus pfennigii]|jgi:hypothetical protein|uniref:hypothetical protein n=1 Tax=Thiococcus pfennigii TaxID=1057 RepID=UPI001903F992|nr:hypothetical protein [Thiococcus pfennigii]MBK1731202.1 hypothetical protein [Thiococcus pfennigii]